MWGLLLGLVSALLFIVYEKLFWPGWDSAWSWSIAGGSLASGLRTDAHDAERSWMASVMTSGKPLKGMPLWLTGPMEGSDADDAGSESTSVMS